jgi:nucleoside 2-deoxyribosyltransferase
LEADHVRVWDYGERITLECGRCGKFTITATAAAMAESRDLRPKLSAWIRDRSETGGEIPEINSRTLNEVGAALPVYRVAEKQLLLLRALERRTAFPGQRTTVAPNLDYPLAWAAGEDELKYLLRALIERGLVRRIDGPPELADSFVFEVELTADGWNFLDAHARPSIISDQAFVAMSFSPDLNPAWNLGIRPALERVHFKPYRVDAEPHIDRIDTKIMTEIKNSRFVVADVTLQRQGVYFEAGYALGLGLPVFWCVRKDDLPNVHFDTRQYNHIAWENEPDLAEQLYLFVNAIVGRGTPT